MGYIVTWAASILTENISKLSYFQLKSGNRLTVLKRIISGDKSSKLVAMFFNSPKGANGSKFKLSGARNFSLMLKTCVTHPLFCI
jgi:hypothetical protein